MAGTWSPEQLERLDDTDDLEIAARRDDGSLARWTPIWVVRVADQVFVRTWNRRETGWFGRAVASGRARVRIPGVEVDVAVEDVGSAVEPDGIAAAYRAKYGRYGSSSVEEMVTAADTTLRLTPEPTG